MCNGNDIGMHINDKKWTGNAFCNVLNNNFPCVAVVKFLIKMWTLFYVCRVWNTNIIEMYIQQNSWIWIVMWKMWNHCYQMLAKRTTISIHHDRNIFSAFHSILSLFSFDIFVSFFVFKILFLFSIKTTLKWFCTYFHGYNNDKHYSHELINNIPLLKFIQLSSVVDKIYWSIWILLHLKPKINKIKTNYFHLNILLIFWHFYNWHLIIQLVFFVFVS